MSGVGGGKWGRVSGRGRRGVQNLTLELRPDFPLCQEGSVSDGIRAKRSLPKEHLWVPSSKL